MKRSLSNLAEFTAYNNKSCKDKNLNITIKHQRAGELQNQRTRELEKQRTREQENLELSTRKIDNQRTRELEKQ